MRRHGWVDHRRARRGVRQAAAHAQDVLRGRPRRVPASAVRLRSRRPCQPREGHAHAQAVRRGPRAVPAASPGACGRGRALLSGRLARVRTEEPGSAEEAAALMRSAAADGALVRFKGGGTKFDWGNPVGEPDVLLSTKGLNRIVEHNAADLTAVLEAGVALAEAQDAFAE